MPTPPPVERLFEALKAALPARLADEFSANLRAALASALERAGFVTREELEVQEQVLARTRARLAEMEKRVTELEAKLGLRT
jgi:BMFP domain-containing protein YqiC